METSAVLTNEELQEMVSVLIKEVIAIKDTVQDVRQRLDALETDVNSIKTSLGLMAELLENLCDNQSSNIM